MSPDRKGWYGVGTRRGGACVYINSRPPKCIVGRAGDLRWIIRHSTTFEAHLETINSRLTTRRASYHDYTERTNTHNGNTQDRRERYTAARRKDCHYYRYDPSVRSIHNQDGLTLPR